MRTTLLFTFYLKNSKLLTGTQTANLNLYLLQLTLYPVICESVSCRVHVFPKPDQILSDAAVISIFLGLFNNAVSCWDYMLLRSSINGETYYIKSVWIFWYKSIMSIYFPHFQNCGFSLTSHFCLRVIKLWKFILLTCCFSMFQTPPMQAHDSRGPKSQVPQSSGHEFKSQYRGTNGTTENLFMYNGWVICLSTWGMWCWNYKEMLRFLWHTRRCWIRYLFQKNFHNKYIFMAIVLVISFFLRC
jgi:hypothetical protein